MFNIINRNYTIQQFQQDVQAIRGNTVPTTILLQLMYNNVYPDRNINQAQAPVNAPVSGISKRPTPK